jgi:hypothetical protein
VPIFEPEATAIVVEATQSYDHYLGTGNYTAALEVAQFMSIFTLDLTVGARNKSIVRFRRNRTFTTTNSDTGRRRVHFELLEAKWLDSPGYVYVDELPAGNVLCPVAALERYLRLASRSEFLRECPFIFPKIDKRSSTKAWPTRLTVTGHATVCKGPDACNCRLAVDPVVDISAMNAQLKTYATRAGYAELGFTIHGTRSGLALVAFRTLNSREAVNSLLGWAPDSKMSERYCRAMTVYIDLARRLPTDDDVARQLALATDATRRSFT